MNKMNIRKQLDGLIKGDMREVNKAADVIFDKINSLVEVGQLDADFHLKLERILDEINVAIIPDREEDISNIRRDKLDEWAKRNEKLDTKNEEKVLGVVASVLTGDDQ